MQKPLNLIILCLLLSLPLPGISQLRWSSEYVYFGEQGKLQYTPDSLGNVIPDFSHVGYMYGDEPIPDIPALVEISPVEGDDGASIQAAIESLYEMDPGPDGFRGAVLLKKGTYEVGGSILINRSGIILRGEGDGEDGTVIIATGKGQRTLIRIGTGSSLVVNHASAINIAESYVPVGRQYVIVNNASGFGAGDHISIYRGGTQNWISDLRMNQIPPRTDGGSVTQWPAATYSFHFERQLTNVSGDTLFFRNPIVMSMETKYGGGRVYKVSRNRLHKVGVEHMLLKSEYTSNTDEDHGWDAVMFNNAEHGWARHITAKYFGYSCINLGISCRHITVTDCKQLDPKSIITGSRRYSFVIYGQLNLIKNCYTSEGRHDFVTQSRVLGPNVFLNSVAENTHSDSGPHHRWTMGTLYDQITTDGELNIQDRGNLGSGHGWTGVNHVVWNSKALRASIQSPWVTGVNYSIGYMGGKWPGRDGDRPDGIWEGHNREGLFPGSLYEAQLDERLNGTRYLSVLPHLNQISDSTFLLRYNFIPDPIAMLNPANYTVGGTAGAEEKLHQVSLADSTSVLLTFADLGILQAFASLNVSVSGIASAQGIVMNGLETAWHHEPDNRPVVLSYAQQVSNGWGEFVAAASTKPGKLFLILLGQPTASQSELQETVEKGLGCSVNAPIAEREYALETFGLRSGFYRIYATDMQGRVSAPFPQLLQILQSTSSRIEAANGQTFILNTNHGQLEVRPGFSLNGPYSVEVFDLTGRTIHRSHGHIESTQIHTGISHSLLLIRITYNNTQFVQKIL
jgi:hypothetical protein